MNTCGSEAEKFELETVIFVLECSEENAADGTRTDTAKSANAVAIA